MPSKNNHLELLIEQTKPIIVNMIKKYGYKIDDIYDHNDLMQEGLATIIYAISKWDGINNKTSLSSYIYLELEWHFKTLAQKHFQDAFQTDFIENFETELSQEDLDRTMDLFFEIEKSPEAQLLEKLASQNNKKDNDIDLFSIMQDLIPENAKNLKQYISFAEKGIFDIDIIAEKMNCSSETVKNLRKKMITLIQNFQFEEKNFK